MVKLISCAFEDLTRYTEPVLRADLTASTKPASRMHNGYVLTDEQNHAVNLAEQKQDLTIEAFAGAGKTSTLSAVSEALPDKKGLYIAFNKAIADEAAQKFPGNVECRTAHSLAYRAIGHEFKGRLNRLSGGHLAKHYLQLHQPIEGLSPASIGSLVLSAISRFTQSADTEITLDHAPWGDLKPIKDKTVKYGIADQVIAYAQAFWHKMIDRESSIPITHDVYLKLWAMSKPTIKKDFILFDEAQDASPVMMDVVCRQAAQKIFVGDHYQQIYKWRGAVNSLQSIDTTNACQITQSFRFGQPIADLANLILNENLDAGVNIRGFERINSVVQPVASPKAILCRTNATVINTLINRLRLGDKVAVSGGCADTISLLKAADQLIVEGCTGHRELALFQSWDELVEFTESEAGSDLAPLVRLVNAHDIGELISTLEQTHRVREEQADLVLATAHKSKGREWSSVTLENDFRHQGSKNYSEEESNLLYVAATRAMHQLDVGECEAVETLFEGEELQPTNA